MLALFGAGLIGGLLHASVAAACQCTGFSTFLESAAGERVEVLRIRVRTRRLVAPDFDVFAQALARPGYRAPKRWPFDDLMLSVDVLERLKRAKAPARIQLRVPSSASCGPRAPEQFVEGSEWYALATSVDSGKASVKTDYMMWAPCGVAALRVDVAKAQVEGEIHGPVESMPIAQLRELLPEMTPRARSAKKTTP